jgi:signal transduction histidine kinase/DNA-binding response OmpR family regulator
MLTPNADLSGHLDPRLKEHGNLLLSAFDHMADGVLVADEQDRVAYWNDRYVQRLPYLREHIRVGCPMIEMVRLGAHVVLPKAGPEDLEKWVQWRMRTRMEGTGQVEFTFADGRTLVFVDRRIPGGSTVCTLRDITDAKATERDLLAEREKAEEVVSKKTQFLHNISREIRTSAQGIIGMSQLLSKKGQVLSVEQVGVIRRSSQSLLNMLNDLLELSRIEDGRVILEARRFNPLDLMEEMSAIFGPRANQKSLALQIQWCGGENDAYLADGAKLRTMLSHVLEHSIAHTAHGQIRLEASLVKTSGVQWLEFCVTDTGLGIDADSEAQFFEPFSKARNHSAMEPSSSSGLGLTIVKGLAQSMGGGVGIREPGRYGCALWFRIPAVVAPDGAIPLQTATTRSARPVATVQADFESTTVTAVFPMLVLVVDDDVVNRQVIKLMLTKLGCTVLEAENGFEGLTMLQAEPRPDLVFMDCAMPVMDGFEATRYLRELERERSFSPMPVIALSATTHEYDKEACFKAGMNEFLAKPVELKSLETVLETYRRPPQSAELLHGAPSVPPSEAASLPYFDSNTLLERLEGDREIALKVIEIFLADLSSYLNDIVQAAQSILPVELARKAHVMAGAASNLSAPELARQARQIEAWTKSGAWPEIMDAIDCLKLTCEHTRENLEAFMKKID